MAEKFNLGDRVKINPTSEFSHQSAWKGIQHEGTIIKMPWDGRYAYGVRWDWMTTGDSYGYNDRDLLPVVVNNATGYSQLKELPEEFE